MFWVCNTVEIKTELVGYYARWPGKQGGEERWHAGGSILLALIFLLVSFSFDQAKEK